MFHMPSVKCTRTYKHDTIGLTIKECNKIKSNENHKAKHFDHLVEDIIQNRRKTCSEPARNYNDHS